MKKVIKNSNGWRKRCLIIVSVLVCLLPTNRMAEGSEAIVCPNQEQICTSAVCVHTASAVLSKIKTEVKPCDNFYQFACGNYIDHTEIPKYRWRADKLTILADKRRKIIDIFPQEKRPETDPKYLKLPNILYEGCMNTDLIERRDVTPMKQVLQALGGWPLLIGSSWDSNNTWTWQETVKNFRRSGFDFKYIVDVSIRINFQNRTKRIISLQQPKVGIFREYLAHYHYIVDLAVLFGAERESAEIELKESLQFEMDLKNISVAYENKSNNLRTIKELQKSYHYNNWLDYISALLPEDLKIDENEVIDLRVPNFFAELGNLLQRSDKRTIANYMMKRALVDSVKLLPERFVSRKLQDADASFDMDERMPRWKRCIKAVLHSKYTLIRSLGALYVRKQFKEGSKATAFEIFNEIRDAFNKTIDESDWMDQTTKQEAKRKLYAMGARIGYPSEYMDNNKLEAFYRKLEIDPDKYFESNLNMNIFNTDLLFGKLRLPVKHTDWKWNIDNIFGFYHREENSIEYPAGAMQAHIFNSQRPNYINYGAIGSDMGEKITYGFDDEGQKFDLNGNLDDWWQPDTKKAFLEEIKCITEQNGNYTDKQTGLMVKFKVNKHIAGNGGLKISYLAYKQWVAKNGVEASLPALNYTSNQMFWVSFAQSHCDKYTAEDLQFWITHLSFIPAELHVLEPLKNNADFSNDFECAAGTPMNPVHKCQVW